MSVLEIVLAAFTVLAAVVAGYWALGRVLIGQFTGALDVRFQSLEDARREGRKQSEERFRELERKLDRTETEVRQILIELPREYVRREDYVRGQTVIEAKLDALAVKWENSELRSRA